ncbi:bifunctional protein GlmU [Bombina bombina]|uniref:bifunctional protein GlmU n=1 Tax=Bombina bombina TaxID=8345 RepID=UPI00235ABC7C|nr:bifunctional protein GlmU [Bombina bombina]
MNPVQILVLLILTSAAAAYLQEGPSALSTYALRLGPGEEILTSLSKFVQEKKLKAPFIITCVGSVTKATLRLANADAVNSNEIIYLEEKLEIVSLVGTLNEYAHLHISLSDKDGKTIGGHAIGDLKVFTTAEIVIGELSDLQFTREMDERTGFHELVIRPRSEHVSSSAAKLCSFFFPSK